MRVAIIGAGIVGVATAYALAKGGAQVDVYERAAGVARGASFANAGQLSPTLAGPWAVPGMLRKAAGWFFMKHPPLRISRLDVQTVLWLYRMLGAANPRSFMTGKRAMVQLSLFSLEQMHRMRDIDGLTYSAGGTGTLVVFRSPEASRAYEKDLAVLENLGLPAVRLTPEAVRGREPHLSRTAKIDSGVLLEADETGDCSEAAQALMEICIRLGVQFHFNAEVQTIIAEAGRVRGLKLRNGTVEADVFVLCAGTHSSFLARQLELSLPVQPLKGYSISIPSDPAVHGPTSTIADEKFKVGVTNLGNQIRVGGTAELAGFDSTRPARRFDVLRYVVRDLFPNIPQEAVSAAAEWSGLRPMTPDGPPVIGRAAGWHNMILNTGHGTLGWTMAAGSAALVAQIAEERQLSLDVVPFAPERFDR